MVFVKIVKRPYESYAGTMHRTYYYLCNKFRDDKGKPKDNIIRKLTTEEIRTFEENKTDFLNNLGFSLRSEIPDHDSITKKDETSESIVRWKLGKLIDEINEKQPPFNKAYRPQKFAIEFLTPLLD